MRRRRLGGTDLFLSELGFGAFGISGNRHGDSYGPTSDGTSRRAILRALELGCSFFDTADIYGCGHSERLLGRVLAETLLGRSALVATKGGCPLDRPGQQDFSRDHLTAAVEASLRRLRRERIDLYLLHNPCLALIRDGGIFDTLERLQAAGKIRHGGVSVHTAEEARAALRAPACAAVEIVFSLLSQLHPERAADAALDEIGAAGVGLLAREPLASGFLARRHRIDEAYPSGDIRAAFPESERRLRMALAEAVRPDWQGAPTAAQLALRYVLDEPLVTAAVVGMKTPAQVEENAGACGLQPFSAYWHRLPALRQGAAQP